MITWSHGHFGAWNAQDIMVGVCRGDFSPQTPRMQEREELRVQHLFQLSLETVTRGLAKEAWGSEIWFCLTRKAAVHCGEDSPGQE